MFSVASDRGVSFRFKCLNSGKKYHFFKLMQNNLSSTFGDREE